MYDLAKMFLHCLNHWKLEHPTLRKQHVQTDDVSVYKVNYTRYHGSGQSLTAFQIVASPMLVVTGQQEHPIHSYCSFHAFVSQVALLQSRAC